jgi:hypothetical protein
MKPLNLMILAPESWRTMEPVGGRATHRTIEREFERIPARFICQRGEAPVKLWDYSSSGFAFIYTYCKDHPLHVKEGDAVTIAIGAGDAALTTRCIVRNTSLFRGNLRIGLNRIDSEKPLMNPFADRGLALPEQARISCEAANPILYGEWSALDLTGVYPGLRLGFVSRDPAMLLFPGQVLDLELGLPMPGRYPYRGKIVALGRHDESSLAVVLEPIQPSPVTSEELAAFLMREAGATRNTLRSLGFPSRLISEHIEFRLAETAEDETRVAALRNENFPAGGVHKAAPEPGAARAQQRRCVLCAYHEATLVAAATFTLPDSDRMVLRTQAAFPGEQFPCIIPEKNELLEITGVTIHKDYRRENLLRPLLEQIVRVFLLSGRRYILRLADARLLKEYRRLGFRSLGAACEHLGTPHHLMMWDTDTVITGKRMGFGCWSILFADVIEDLIAKGLVRLTPWQAFRMAVKLKAKPWVKRLAAARNESMIRIFLTGSEDEASWSKGKP